MKIIEERFIRNIDYRKYFNSQNICFIDIETTGLSKQYNSIYLIGILYPDNKNNNHWILKQLFAEKIDEEKIVLLNLVQLMSSYDMILTYNGETFDLPFINERLKRYNIEYEFHNSLSMDLYKEVKSYRHLLNIENLKLKTLERYLGLYRDDIYTGKDCIQFYYDYLKTKDKELMARILQHNYDDLYYMIDILRILDIIIDKKTFTIVNQGNAVKLSIDKLSILGDQLIVKGIVQDNTMLKIIYYGNNYSIYFDENNSFEIKIEISLGMVAPQEKGIYIDTEKYLLPSLTTSLSEYNLPSNILLIKVDKHFFIENIKNLLNEIITYTLSLI